MKLANVLYKLYVDPWAILPAAHANLCAIVDDHFTGRAHAQDGRHNSYVPDEGKDSPDDYEKHGNLAIIEINGVIGRRVGDMEKSSGVSDVLDIERALEAAVAGGAEGILLSFDSPGGAVSGVPELAARIAEVNVGTPVVAYCDGLCCSAAYWLASQASMIVSGKTAQSGSVGVYQAFLDESRAMEFSGRRMELFTTGKFKGMGISGIPLTDEQRSLLQSRVDQVFGWFKGAVASGRGKVPDEAMQGQSYYGEDAVKVNLVDTIGSRSDALAELSALIGLKRKG